MSGYLPKVVLSDMLNSTFFRRMLAFLFLPDRSQAVPSIFVIFCHPNMTNWVSWVSERKHPSRSVSANL